MGLLRHPFDLLSGPWSGHWIQGRHPGRERLDLLLLAGNLMGFGADQYGRFQVHGAYTPQGIAEFRKIYTKTSRPIPARRTYQGQWDGRALVGRWSEDDASGQEGPFRLWPGEGSDPDEVQDVSETSSQETGPTPKVRVNPQPPEAGP